MIKETGFLKDKSGNVVPLDGVKAMLKIKEMLTAPIAGPAHFAEALRCWRFTLAFGMTAVEENQYPALTKCWNDLSKRFRAKTDDDGTIIDSCVFADFKFGDENKSFAAYLRDKMSGEAGMEALCDFLQRLDNSRLGLYQVNGVNKDIIKLEESFTKKTLKAANTIDFCGSREIFLVRLVQVGDDQIIFGDPKAWPASHKVTIENMVLDKMLTYCLDRKMLKRGEVPSEAKMYLRYMKMAGPYWISVVLDEDADAEVLPPNFFKRFL